jgi:uroporphyrinogen-III synthase
MNIDKIKNLTIVTVGDATAATAREAGFANVISVGENVDDLGTYLIETYGGKDNKFLHFAGTSRAGDLNALTDLEGPTIDVIEVYRAVAEPNLTSLVATAIKANQINGVILMSPRTAEIYASLIIKSVLGSDVEKYAHYCLSANVANALDPLHLSQNKIAIASRSDLETLLALIRK